MNWFLLNCMSPKVIVKMHRKGKGWFSSQENGLFQPVLKPGQILIQNSHKNQPGKLVTCTTSFLHVMNWGEKPEDWKLCLNQLRPDGRSLLITILQCRNSWVSLPLKTDWRGRWQTSLCSYFFIFSHEENAPRKSQAALKLCGCQGQHLLTWICTHTLDQRGNLQ